MYKSEVSILAPCVQYTFMSNVFETIEMENVPKASEYNFVFYIIIISKHCSAHSFFFSFQNEYHFH